MKSGIQSIGQSQITFWLKYGEALFPLITYFMFKHSESVSSTESDKEGNSADMSQPTKPVGGGAGPTDVERPAEEDLSEEFYEVERIVDHENTKEGLFYLVRWKGFTEADDSWEPAENLSLATKAIFDYETSRKINPKRRRRTSAKLPASSTHKRSVKKRIASKSAPKKRDRSLETPDDSSDSERKLSDRDSDYEEATLSKNRKRTMTKAALESYPATTPKKRRTTPPSETPKKVTQRWLYESDSDGELEADKEHEKRVEQRKNKERERTDEEDKQHQNEKESFATCSNMETDNICTWQTEASNLDNNGKSKGAEQGAILDEIKREVPSEESDNGVAAAVANEDNGNEQHQVFAIGKTSDGRIRVLVGTDDAKRVVSLRGARFDFSESPITCITCSPVDRRMTRASNADAADPTTVSCSEEQFFSSVIDGVEWVASSCLGQADDVVLYPSCLL
uniref:Chromo domain-containing protein n=1 Tax=Angiostrongylus cantonensis TaxID=6313 RepID=A0A158PAK2_ANGCA